MINAASKLLAVLLAVLLLYVYPAAEVAERQDDIARMTASQSVTRFVDAVRTKGYISPRMLAEFEEQLARTGNDYHITMEHLHKKYVPRYTDPMNPSSFTGAYEVVYDGYYLSQIRERLFPLSGTLTMDDPGRRYTLGVGDFFSVSLKSTNRTPSMLIREWLQGGTAQAEAVFTAHGGMVLNEDY
ncbi:hypothetical protein HUB98_03490 [Paenibacillus barcinonensis]|uniref:Uncharacterized protein n=1 Tax=Paenibacillus barcinonensis TaxID=198119 RepID=A0A2V4VVZ8_PAEBA|nr:hypothetical protein [Paenibacillus barcinonensis]PYE49238.1 hypothetical protein DFQ00_106221 [Paenibacillus barcinonensis]QKS55469.1 hypothetical protein HUB98_03490 [Paenibacillus barcinonensis]